MPKGNFMMDTELMQVLRRLAEGKHPDHDWPMDANHVTHVSYVGIKGRKTPVRAWITHIPRVGEHVRWMKWVKKKLDFRFSYYEVVQVLWDVRDGYQYLYRPGDEGEGYLTVFLKPVKNSPGEALDREEGRKRRRGPRVLTSKFIEGLKPVG
jgi:hypothetical protein